jgi:hypothetical protein
MSDRVFYVGAQQQSDEKKITGYVPAKFLTLNGKPVVDPRPGGSQRAYIYGDGSDRYKMGGEIANPNNYLIVPANYPEQQARAFAAEIVRATVPAQNILKVSATSNGEVRKKSPEWGKNRK